MRRGIRLRACPGRGSTFGNCKMPTAFRKGQCKERRGGGSEGKGERKSVHKGKGRGKGKGVGGERKKWEQTRVLNMATMARWCFL